jgi:hypothetical protein
MGLNYTCYSLVLNQSLAFPYRIGIGLNYLIMTNYLLNYKLNIQALLIIAQPITIYMPKSQNPDLGVF